MRSKKSSLVTLGAAASVAALAVTPLASAPEARAAAPSAAAVPVGAIPAAFIRNQLTFCGLICPSIVQLVTTVPVGVAQAPVAFVGGLQTGSLLRAIGAAAESVTNPADVATTGIITPDVFIVVPKAIGTTLPIVVVQAFNVGEALVRPGELLPTIETARERILEALNTPASSPPTDLPSGAQGVVEVATVAGVNVFDAVAFRAGELLLAGVVHTANVTATELANTGDVGSALGAGAAAANIVVGQARTIVTDAVDTAASDIRASLHQPQVLAGRSAVRVGTPGVVVRPRVAKPSSAKPEPGRARPVAGAVKSVARHLSDAVHHVTGSAAD
jgi:hypothetical protein